MYQEETRHQVAKAAPWLRPAPQRDLSSVLNFPSSLPRARYTLTKLSKTLRQSPVEKGCLGRFEIKNSVEIDDARTWYCCTPNRVAAAALTLRSRSSVCSRDQEAPQRGLDFLAGCYLCSGRLQLAPRSPLAVCTLFLILAVIQDVPTEAGKTALMKLFVSKTFQKSAASQPGCC